MKVKCKECGHLQEIMGDTITTWKCSCVVVQPEKCDCDHTNVIEEATE